MIYWLTGWGKGTWNDRDVGNKTCLLKRGLLLVLRDPTQKAAATLEKGIFMHLIEHLHILKLKFVIRAVANVRIEAPRSIKPSRQMRSYRGELEKILLLVIASFGWVPSKLVVIRWKRWNDIVSWWISAQKGWKIRRESRVSRVGAAQKKLQSMTMKEEGSKTNFYCFFSFSKPLSIHLLVLFLIDLEFGTVKRIIWWIKKKWR